MQFTSKLFKWHRIIIDNGKHFKQLLTIHNIKTQEEINHHKSKQKTTIPLKIKDFKYLTYQEKKLK